MRSRKGEIRQRYIQTLLPASARFWLRVYPAGDCWEWHQGGKRSPSYGDFRADRNMKALAHRYAFSLTKDLRWDTVVDHTCNHPWCVRPSHLVASTDRENTLRGRGPTAQRARQTLCKNGHPLYPKKDNSGQRICRICSIQYHRRIRAQRSRFRWPEGIMCHRGHVFTDANVTVRKNGTLRCRACQQEDNRRRYPNAPKSARERLESLATILHQRGLV